MNPDLEKFIDPIIVLHKNSIGKRYDWSAAQKQVPGLLKSDREALKSGMIDMGIVEYSSDSDKSRTLLIKFDFNIVEYKAEQNREKAKKWYETQNAKNTYNDFSNVKKRADDALNISKSALVISGLLALLTLIKWICSG
jgi:hypothetical protein